MENSATLYSIASVLLVSLMSLAGVSTLLFSKELLDKVLIFLVSLAAGTLIGDVFFHIFPELDESTGFTSNIGLAVLVGIMLFFGLEKFLHWHHCHNGDTKNHNHPVAINNLVADGVHNFLDGIIIASSFAVSTEIGIATTIAVILHEIPQEIGDFGVLVYSGFSRAKALTFNLLSGFLALAGAIVVLLLDRNIENITPYFLAVTAGGFIYIAVADLIPEIKKESDFKKSIAQYLIVVLGMVLMFGLTFFE